MTHYSKVKRYTLGLFAAIALLTTPACNDDLGLESEKPSNEPALRICLTIDGDNFSRAGNLEDGGTMPGEGQTDNGNFHENSIHSLDLFFYRNIPDVTDVTDDTPSLLHIHTTNIDVTGNKVHTLVSLSSLQELIDHTESEFRIVAVANYKEANKDDMSRNALRALVVKADATYSNSESRAFRGATAPNDFVMHNLNQTVTVRVEDKEYDDEVTDATVSLRRVAAKIRVGLNIIDEYEDSYGTTWVPDIAEARVYFTNGVRTARLDGDFDALCNLNNPPSLNDTGDDYTNSDYYSIATSGSKATEDYTYARPLLDFAGNMETIVGDSRANNFSAYHYVNALPLYTYPTKWEDSSFELHQPTIVVVLPWEVKDAEPGVDDEESTYKVCYYSMPVNNDGSIVSNAYYFARARIAMMGGESPQQPLQVDVECEMSEWGTARDTEADIRPLRYLQFNQTEFKVYNQGEITIPFYSSHNCEITDFTGKFYLFNTNTTGTPAERTFDTSVSVGNTTNGSGFAKDKFFYYEIDNTDKTLTLYHHFFDIWGIGSTSGTKVTRFNSGTSQNSTYHKFCSPFEVEFTVKHTGEPNTTQYQEHIKITLYPGIYVEVERNTGDQGVNGRTGGDRGYVYVNGTATGTDNLAGVYGERNDETRHMTIITITQLNEEDKDKYVIADPRTFFINTLLSDASMNSDVADVQTLWTASGKSSTPQAGKTLWSYPGYQWWNSEEEATNSWLPDDQDRTLRYYYPTREFSDTKNLIAPRLRITSGFAYLGNNMSREVARRRCASYQEYGYPAGRWRLPTYAEAYFIIMLSKEYDIIPKLFSNLDYWHAHGQLDGADGDEKSASGSAYVRCVYDDWYWQNEDGTPNKIPLVNENGGDTRANKEYYTIFTLGDRPKESVLTNSETTTGGASNKSSISKKHSVERFLEMHQGIKAVK